MANRSPGQTNARLPGKWGPIARLWDWHAVTPAVCAASSGCRHRDRGADDCDDREDHGEGDCAAEEQPVDATARLEDRSRPAKDTAQSSAARLQEDRDDEGNGDDDLHNLEILAIRRQKSHSIGLFLPLLATPRQARNVPHARVARAYDNTQHPNAQYGQHLYLFMGSGSALASPQGAGGPARPHATSSPPTDAVSRASSAPSQSSLERKMRSTLASCRAALSAPAASAARRASSVAHIV